MGTANYCHKALMDKGWIKAKNFKNSRSRAAYLYKLTPQGIEEKTRITFRFLKHKLLEYDLITAEIEEIRMETQGTMDEVGQEIHATGQG